MGGKSKEEKTMSNIKDLIRQEIDTRRQHMVEELMGHEENCEYHRIKGMHDAYVDLLTFLDYSLPEEKPSEDLEKAAKEYVKDIPTFKDSCLMKAAFEDGWLCSKEKMLKDAVEGDVADLNGEIYNNCIEKGMTDEDKVKIIIIKGND
jgi:hypothetical protein